MTEREQLIKLDTKLRVNFDQQEIINERLKTASGYAKAVLMNESARLIAEEDLIGREYDSILRGREWWMI